MMPDDAHSSDSPLSADSPSVSAELSPEEAAKRADRHARKLAAQRKWKAKKKAERIARRQAMLHPEAATTDALTTLAEEILALKGLRTLLDAKIAADARSADIRLRADVSTRLSNLVQRVAKLRASGSAPLPAWFQDEAS